MDKLIAGGICVAIDPAFLRDSILSHSDFFASAYRTQQLTIRHLNALIQFLLKEGLSSILDVPILPLRNPIGGLATIGRYEGHYPYIWCTDQETVLLERLFPTTTRILEPSLAGNHLLKHPDLNVRALGSAEVAELIQQHYSGRVSCELSSANEIRVDALCKELSQLKVDYAAIKEVTLVRTTSTSRGLRQYLSIARCSGVDVFPEPSEHARFSEIIRYLKHLGAIFVPVGSLRSSLQAQLRLDAFSTRRVLDFLTSVKSSGRDIIGYFAQLNDTSSNALARQIRTWLLETVHVSSYLGVAKYLPVWPVIRRGEMHPRLVPASDVEMLAAGYTLATFEPFLRHGHTIVEFSSTLSRLQLEPLKPRQLWNRLDLTNTTTVSEADLPLLIPVLKFFINNDESWSKSICVPDSCRRMRDAQDLFARSEPLYVAALAEQPQRLIHPALRHLEAGLKKYGLRMNVDIDNFRECAQAIHDSSGEEGAAAHVFQYFADRLPLLIPASNAWAWNRLDDLRFIPRSQSRSTRHAFPLSGYVKELPFLVSPSETLRPEHEAIGWTQRALPTRPENGLDRLLIARPSFGVPSVREVVHHLKALARIASDQAPTLELLGDITQTYQWLEERNVEAGDHLLDFHTEPLFLNVDDPRTECWQWDSAEQLIFNAPDEDRRRAVRGFLQQYRKLILAGGGHEIQAADRPEVPRSSAEEALNIWRCALRYFRDQKKFVDVTIWAEDAVFDAHRVVLAASSEYFKTLFASGVAESQESAISVAEYRQNIVRHALSYIYEGMITNELDNEDDLIELLRLAVTWGLNGLNIDVQQLLIAKITPKTYRDLRQLGDECRYSSMGEPVPALLANACVNFAEKNARELRSLGV
ncbi:hypothetical protein PUNSTDRAFT_146680 [Punctularia strigosozonata HHB-11173 SS5]|uniref:BTB domain-containing protein n=1 Tax=Punctularia strigosozonata (strain HHB-11173) TaxID=741275 RepID=R7S331_PUNST|nr:uncharacterized protein PUNSTDRAFT_146680 [Punctularia strigosozonata HHB-11173 SS5]EIN04202.1 hypothetical protein PUNSTDRAFT_146680 [Punctularia strigosozonata HHB-11173 SS5]